MGWLLSFTARRSLIDILPLRSWPFNGMTTFHPHQHPERSGGQFTLQVSKPRLKEVKGLWSRSSGSLVAEMGSELGPVSNVPATFSRSLSREYSLASGAVLGVPLK